MAVCDIRLAPQEEQIPLFLQEKGKRKLWLQFEQ
jgi:hypothetical protein